MTYVTINYTIGVESSNIRGIMKKYFSIGEVSRLKGISIKALRYYDKIGILKPAYVNPDTGYRYYLPNQLFLIDFILFCVEMDIPLKSFNNYRGVSNDLQLIKLLEMGEKIAKEKIESIKLLLIRIERFYKNINMFGSHNMFEQYSRFIPERLVLRKKWEDKDLESYISIMSNLYDIAEKLKAAPLYQSGVIFDTNFKYVYIEILNRVKDDSFFIINGGQYKCYIYEIKEENNIIYNKDIFIEEDVYDKNTDYARSFVERQEFIIK